MSMNKYLQQQKQWMTKRYKRVIGFVVTMLVLDQGVLAFLSWVITSVFA